MLDFSGWQWWDGNKNLRPIRSIDVYVYFINPPWRIKKCMPYFYVLPFTITQMLHGAGIFTNIYPKNHPNVGKYFIHGASGSTKTPVMLASMDTIHGFYGYYGMAINHNGPIDLKGRVAGGQFDKSSLVLAEKNKYKKHFKATRSDPKNKTQGTWYPTYWDHVSTISQWYSHWVSYHMFQTNPCKFTVCFYWQTYCPG